MQRRVQLAWLSLLIFLTRPTVAPAAEEAPADTEKSTQTLSVVMANTIKGELIVTGPLRERRTHLKFDDRGRGPDRTAVSIYDEQGLPAEDFRSRRDLRQATDERAVRDHRRSRQMVERADTGETRERGFYLINEGNAEDAAALAR